MNNSIIVYTKENKKPLFVTEEGNTFINVSELILLKIKDFYSRIYGNGSISIKQDLYDYTVTTPDNVVNIRWDWI